MERYLSVLTPTSANRCDPFNEARASDLALRSSGKIFRKKHRIIPAPLFTTQCLASLPPWNWHVVLRVGTTPPWQVAPSPFARATQWASDSLSKTWSQLSRASPREWKKSDTAVLNYRAILGKSRHAETKETRGPRKENIHEYCCHNSVGKDSKSKNKRPTLCDLLNRPIFFFF